MGRRVGAIRWSARSGLLVGLVISLVANAVFIPAYVVSQQSDRPGTAVYDIRADIYNAAIDVRKYKATHQSHELDRAALWMEMAAGTVIGSRAFANFADMCDNLAGDLAYRKNVPQAIQVVEKMANLWPSSSRVLARDEASRQAFDERLQVLMAKLPQPGSTPLY